MTQGNSKHRLQLWLQLLKAQRQIESALRDKLRAEFGSTLPRFDVLSALDGAEGGLRMSELSAVLKVSNGNVTGIVERLVSDQQVERVPVKGDRRAMRVKLTDKGKEKFYTMANVHEEWVSDLLGSFSPEESEALCMTFETLNTELDKRGMI